MGRTKRATDRTQSTSGRVEDQTDHPENQRAHEVSQKDHLFNLPDLEFERKVRGEIVQARSSMQKGLGDERTGLCFERKTRRKHLVDLLPNHRPRFSILADRLLERKVPDAILEGLEEQRQDRFFEQVDRFWNHSEKEVIHTVRSLEHTGLFSNQAARSFMQRAVSLEHLDQSTPFFRLPRDAQGICHFVKGLLPP